MKTILLIEDEKPLRESICEILKFEGYDVLEADNGLTAVEIALDRFPDLILCDIMLPGLNGYEVFKEIKSQEAMVFTPFIFLTALANESDIRTGMGLGADDYVTKPFKRDDLIRTIQARFQKLEEIGKKEDFTEELISVNQGLEDFAHFISHQLKNPLVIVNMFSQILLNDYAENLDKQGQDYIQTICTFVKRMNTMIDGLLAFSRQRKSEIRRTNVNIGKIVKSIIGETESYDRGKKVTFIVGDLPDADCDEEMIRQVFTNLISNAVKYSHEKKKPVVEIGSSTSEGNTTYFVKDNGVGFDMINSHHLFQVFRRLHKESEFSGIGLGLAIVKDIVEKHGGRTWAEAFPDKGATFFFTLK